MVEDRPSREEYYMNLAKETAKRSSCLCRSGPKGAVIVASNGCIISTGYNGAPRGVLNCYERDEGVCLRKKFELNHGSFKGYEICPAVHAEANAIVAAARNGVRVEGSTLYVTHLPCISCSKLIINAGIVEVVYEIQNERYPTKEVSELLRFGKVYLRKLKKS